MKFKGKSIPERSKGMDGFGVSEFVPNQSLSLHEILMRFSRGEAMDIGTRGAFGEAEDEDLDNPLNVDLEKVRHMDLVDKHEFIDEMKAHQDRYRDQEMAKKLKQDAIAAEEAKKAEERRIRRMARNYAKENSEKTAK